FERLRPDDHSLYPGVEPGRDRRLVADPPAELARDVHAPEDRSHRLDIDGPAGLGPVQIDQMDPGCSLRLPVSGHGRGIIAKNGLLGVIPLSKANATTPSQVDGRDHLHDLHQNTADPSINSL